MKNKIKGLLALVLSVLIGQIWAADPVATWTDFSTLTSGNYTLTKDAACTVNDDGSITLDGAGLELSFSAGQPAYDNNSITVVMDVSNVPSDAKLVDVTTNGKSDNLYYGTDGKLYQREGTTANYGNCAWTAERATIAFAYGAGGGNTTGTTTYINGVKSIDADNLKWTGSGRYVTKVAFPATGMTIHSIRVYGTKIPAAEIPASVPMAAFGVNFMNGTGQELTVGGFEKGLHNAPAKWLNVTGSANGSGTISVGQTQYGVDWTAYQGTWKSECSTDTAVGKLLYGYLDDCINSGRVKATVTITGLPTDKKYAVALILSGDGATNTDANGKFSPVLINGETYSYVNGALVMGDTAKAATTWGDRSKAAAAEGLAEGTNVMFVEGLTGDTLTITSALDAQNTSRLTIAGVQVWIMGDSILAVPSEGLTYTEDMVINREVSGTGTLTADNCTLDVTEATMNGCSLAAQNNGVIVLKADQLDTIGGLTIPQGATVKIITDAIDAVIAGEATFAMPENTTIAGTVTLLTLDGEKEATAEIADGILTAKFTANPTVVGSTWWWDYEFNGNGNNTGSEGTNLKWDGDRPLINGAEYTESESDGNQMLKLPSRPWRDVSIWPTSATFVMKAKAGTQPNGILVAFGSSAYGTTKTITLMTGENPENGDMRLVLTTGKNSLIDLVENLSVPNATTSYHLYAFTLETVNGKTTICVYVDGELLAMYTSDSAIALGTGLQIASVHGGPPTGMNRLANEDTATMDFLRVTDSILSEKALKAMAGAYPYVSPNGKATRTVTAADDTWAGIEAETPWSQMTLNEDATSTTVAQAAPNAGTEVEVTINEMVSLALNNEAVVYETLTITGDGALTLTSDEANTGTIQVSGRTKIETDVTVSPAVKIGAVTVADGCTLTFDYSAYDFTTLYANTTIPLTGLADMGADADVNVDLPEMPEWVVSAEPVFDSHTKTWSLVVTMAGELTATISESGNWDSITWKVGDVVIAQPNLEVLETIPLIVPADATLSMDESVTVKNLTISGEGALIIAKNGNNKLIVSGATTINAHVTATASAATLGSITISADKSLTIKEKIANVGRIASNSGELVYAGGNITEDRQLTNAIGAIRIASGTVNFTSANGDYTSGAITIDNGATMKVSGGQYNSFGSSPITNNGAIVSAGTSAHLYPVVSGTGTLTVESGALTLHGANTYQGGTTIANGTLVVSGANATAKVLPEGKTVTVNANATIKLVQGLSFVTIEGEGKTLVSGTYTYGISNSFQNTLATKTVEVEEEGVLQFRAWRAYTLTIDTLIVNGTLKNEGLNNTTVPTVTVDQGQKLSGTGTIELAVTLADGALVGNVEVVPTAAVVQGSVTCDTAEIATALAEKLTPPTGYHFNVTDKVLSIALNKVTVTIPAAPANTKWFMGETEVSGTIAVDPNTDVTLTLKAEEGYVFADGSTSTTVTVNSGAEGATVETPNVTAATPVAQVGETKYQTLQDAFAAAKAGDTITLLADVTINSRLDIAQNVTIDLNGQTIDETVEDQFGAIYVKKGVTLTIAATNGGEITTDGGIVIGNYGTVIVNGGTIAAGEEPEADVSIYNFYYQADWYGTTTINGGTVARIWNCGVATLAGGTITDVDNSGAMGITKDATVANIILRDGTDAPGIEGAGTLTAPEGLTVTTMDGQKAVYADGKYIVVEKPAIQLTIDLGDGVSSVDYTIAGNKTTITEDTTIDIAESGTVVSFAVVAADGYFAPTVEAVTVTETTTVTIAGVVFSEVESADAAITADNRNAVYAWAKSNGKSQSEVSAANYLYADYLFNFTKFSTAEPTIEITEFTADPLVIKAKVTVNGVTKIEDLSATGLKLNGTLKYKAAPTLEALEAAEPKAMLEATDRFFKVVVE